MVEDRDDSSEVSDMKLTVGLFLLAGRIQANLFGVLLSFGITTSLGRPKVTVEEVRSPVL